MELPNSPSAASYLRLCLQSSHISRFVAARVQLSVREWQCLLLIALEKPYGVRQIASSLGIRSTSTSRVLHTLERKGLITRGLDLHDKRVRHVALTPEGEQKMMKILSLFDHESELVTAQADSAHCTVF